MDGQTQTNCHTPHPATSLGHLPQQRPLSLSMAKGKGKTAASTAPSMCLCNHPFNCDCGNRPERPSLGHKWDGETQVSRMGRGKPGG